MDRVHHDYRWCRNGSVIDIFFFKSINVNSTTKCSSPHPSRKFYLRDFKRNIQTAELLKLQLLYILQYSSFTRFFLIFNYHNIFWPIITELTNQSFHPVFSGLTRRNITMFYIQQWHLYITAFYLGTIHPAASPLKQRVLFFCARYLCNTKRFPFWCAETVTMFKNDFKCWLGLCFLLPWLTWTWFQSFDFSAKSFPLITSAKMYCTRYYRNTNNILISARMQQLWHTMLV